MSEVKVNKVSPRSGTNVQLGDSGDTITIPSGATLANSGTFTNFQSTGIDDNATSTAITIDSNETSTLQCSAGDSNFALLAYHPTSTGTRTIAKFQSDVGGTQEDKVVIQTSGNVGIGTTSPAKALHVVSGTTDDGVRIESTDLRAFIGTIDNTGSTYFGGSGANFVVYTGGDTAGAGSSEKMRITSGGNVGIGTSSPSVRLDARISTLTGKVVEFHNSGGFGIGFTVESNGGVNTINSESNQALAFATNGTSNERMRIDSSGFLLVNTTSTGGRLVVHEDAGARPILTLQDTDASPTFSNRFVRFRDGSGTEIGHILRQGSAVAYVTSSDYRIKENVNYNFDATTRLKQLKPARFNFIADANTTVDGFLAHEVSSIVPEAISGEKDAVDEDGNPQYQGIDQSKLVPLLVKTIQELEARITQLENA
jgi:hypothetical protein